MRDFPWAQILVIACVRFAEPIAFTSLFPYVYFMVKDFGVAESEAEVSKYSGYLSSTFAFCQVLTSFNWGKFADRNGRKPTILIGLTGSIISLLLLGFAKNYYWALAARSIMGLLNGNVAVVRTIIGEVATERKHQALAFSTMPLIFQIGCVIGPLVGGYLSGRETSFDFLRPLVQKYPYALPNICVSSFLVFGLFVAVFFLEETHHKHKYRRDYGVEIGDYVLNNVFKVQTATRHWVKRDLSRRVSSSRREQNPSLLNDEEQPLIDDDPTVTTYTSQPNKISSSKSEDSIQSVGRILTRRESVALVRTYSIHEDGDEDDVNYRELLTPHIFYAVVCNFIMSLHIVVHDEFLPIFLAYDVAKTETGELVSKFPLKLTGGLGFTSQDTGQLLSSTGVLGIFFILIVFPYVDRKYDCLTTYKMFIWIFPVIYLLVPYDVFLANYSKFTAKCVIYVMTSLKALGTSISFPQMLLIVHNSADPKHRALINGAAISVSALARFVGPLLWGFIMSWGQLYNIAWIGWWSLSLLGLLAIQQSQYLRDSAVENEQAEDAEHEE